ncbi:MAG TPA: shikimate dehydrogenase, partial [Acidimicrobiales bacterium]|nr:shikimate dehydrogenase [Acidimicrobiales bacterium]
MRGISGSTRLSGVIGAPIRHSLSPAIFNAAFAAADLDWAYLAFEVAPDETASALDAMRALDFGGLSVTMPHKDAVARLVDRCSDDASALHAVNCVVPTDDGLVGENTDGPGFIDAVRTEVGLKVNGCRAVVFGAGGAARAIVLALARAGARDVAVVNRTSSRAHGAATLGGSVGRVADVGAVVGADLVVNATSVGMTGDLTPFDPELLEPGQIVVDAVYHPS